jgi:hypothetical protein
MRRHRHHHLHRNQAVPSDARIGAADGRVAGRVPEATAPGARRDDAVLVAVAPTLVERLDGLAAALGPGYRVEPGIPAGAGLAILRAPTPTTVAFWRARHPGTGLFVIDPFGEGSATDCLEAGADAYVAGPVTTAEVAAIVVSLARRLGAAPLPA